MDLQRQLHLVDHRFERADRGDELIRRNRHEHASVAQPLRDPNAVVGRNASCRGTERSEDPHRFVVAMFVAEYLLLNDGSPMRSGFIVQGAGSAPAGGGRRGR